MTPLLHKKTCDWWGPGASQYVSDGLAAKDTLPNYLIFFNGVLGSKCVATGLS